MSQKRCDAFSLYDMEVILVNMIIPRRRMPIRIICDLIYLAL